MRGLFWHAASASGGRIFTRERGGLHAKGGEAVDHTRVGRRAKRGRVLRSGKGFGPVHAEGSPQTRGPSGTRERVGEESEESTSVEESEESLKRIIAREGAVRHLSTNRGLRKERERRRRCGNGESLPPGGAAEGEGARCGSTELQSRRPIFPGHEPEGGGWEEWRGLPRQEPLRPFEGACFLRVRSWLDAGEGTWRGFGMDSFQKGRHPGQLGRGFRRRDAP